MFRRTLNSAVLLASLVLAVQTFVALGWLRPVVVAGDSMTPGLDAGDWLLVRRLATPGRGEVVVFRSPVDARRLLVKRALGLPGERVAFRDGVLWINGKRNPTTPGGVYYGAMGNPVWTLGPDEWLVVGDNQRVSIDSRNWDAAAGVPTRLIVGVVADQRRSRGFRGSAGLRPVPDCRLYSRFSDE